VVVQLPGYTLIYREQKEENIITKLENQNSQDIQLRTGIPMTTAVLLLLIAGLLIFLYYLIMFQEQGKLSHFFGMLAGIWAFFGVFLVMGGVVGTGYFIFLITILVIGYLANLVVPVEYYEDILERVGEVTERIPSISVSEERYERIPVVKNMGEESGLGALTFFVIFILYFLFLLTPVTPATTDAPFQFDEKEGPYRFFPNAYQKSYVNGMAKVVIITMRMIPISKGIIDSGIEKAEGEIEEHIEEEVDRDAEVERVAKRDIERNGHDGIEYEYEVSWEEGGIGGTHDEKGTLILSGWYCSNKLQVVAVGVFYPEGMENTRDLAENVECH